MAVIIKAGDAYLTESVAPHAHWSENAADAICFPDAGTANAYLAARAVSFTTFQLTVNGHKDRGHKSID